VRWQIRNNNKKKKQLNIDIQIIQSNELEELKILISIFEKVFEMDNFKQPKLSHLQNLLDKESFFAITAKKENKTIAGLTVYVLDQYYSDKPLAYLYDLAVLKEHQRKGVGKKLIDFTKDFFRKKGFEEVFVQADKIDGYAIDFYRSTNPTEEEQVVHFYYTLTANQS
jgi:aminoglycoside 3-N-acetyltransferase I